MKIVRVMLAAGVMAAMAGCSAVDKTAQTVGTADTPAAGDPLAQFTGQKLVWAPCETQPDENVRFDCATMEVPMDYNNPSGPTFQIALNRLPASDPSQRIGSMFTNPGGPGGSGLGFGYAAAEFFTPRLRARYDVIGMDPRGVGESNPVVCKVTDEMAKAKSLEEYASSYAQGCVQESGAILQHVVTPNVVRDLDLARSLVGDQKFNYYGISYGTVIGQFYAAMFPKNIGRMTLDSVANTNGWPGDPTAQSLGFETAFGIMVGSCIDRGGCPLGTDRAEITARTARMLKALDKKPITVARDQAPVSDQEVMTVLQQAAYQESSWPVVTKALGAALNGDGKPIRRLTGAQSGTDEDSDDTMTSGSFYAIACPHERPEERTVKAAREAGREARSAAPLFGSSVEAMQLICAKWPVQSLAQAGKALRADGSPTILLAVNSADAATPASWARGLHGSWDNSVLVVNESGGHGFYPMGACTHKVVDDFMLNGKQPEAGTSCRDRDPSLIPPLPKKKN